MFSSSEIQKLLSEIIPSTPAEGIFPKYEMVGKPFFDKANNAIITPVIRFKPAYIDRKGDELLRAIYFILKKNESANTMMLIFLKTNEELSQIPVGIFLQKIEEIAPGMLQSLADVR